MNLKNFSFTKDWTLFLDRDGVINRRIPGSYVTRWDEFEFLDGVLKSLHVLAGIFGRIILVSNQQGIGKGLMTVEQLREIDTKMKADIIFAGGWIDASYYAPQLAQTMHPDRKPGTGMGLRAKADFPEIDFSKSIMAGDSAADIEFGKNLGMVTVLISPANLPALRPDLHFKSLAEFTMALNTKP